MFGLEVSFIIKVSETCVYFGSNSGESVEENANLVIRLLIRRPECLGPALRGEGEGLLSAIESGNKMSEEIQQLIETGQAENLNFTHPMPIGDEDEDWIDTGAAILAFYCTLVDLLGRCAPEPSIIGIVDPQGRPTVTIGSDHYLHTCRQSACSQFSKSRKSKNLQVRIVISTVKIVDLAEGIIDDTYLIIDICIIFLIQLRAKTIHFVLELSCGLWFHWMI